MSDQPKKRGRPPAEEPSTTLCVWIYSKQYDALATMASQRDMSVSALVKHMLTKAYPALGDRMEERKKTA